LITIDEENILIELSNSPSSNTPVFPFFTNRGNSASSYLENRPFKKPSLKKSNVNLPSSSLFLNSTFLSDLQKLVILL